MLYISSIICYLWHMSRMTDVIYSYFIIYVQCSNAFQLCWQQYVKHYISILIAKAFFWLLQMKSWANWRNLRRFTQTWFAGLRVFPGLVRHHLVNQGVSDGSQQQSCGTWKCVCDCALLTQPNITYNINRPNPKHPTIH